MGKRQTAGALQAGLGKTRVEFEQARKDAEQLANDEASHLQTDEDYLRWKRQSRLAEQRQVELQAEVSRLEGEIDRAVKADILAAYSARYTAAAERNREVRIMYQTELVGAWNTIAKVLEAAARAELETASVLREMPAGFSPPTALVDPEGFRQRPSQSEEVLSSEVVELRVDAATGSIFANQSAPLPPGRKVVLRKFIQEKYLPHRAARSVGPFCEGLTFPRLTDFGPPLFDGSRAVSPQAVLDQLSAPRTEPINHPLTRIRPITVEKPQATFGDAGPPV